MLRSAITCALVLTLGATVQGCFFLPFDPDPEVVSGSPCQRVNLMDGLDEESTQEIADLYDCLNQSHAFEALGPSVDVLVEGSDRHVESLGAHAAHIVNRAPELIPIGQGLTLVRELLGAQDEFLLDALHLVAEWVYGLPWPEVERLAEQGSLADARLLAEGPLGHMVPILRVWAQVIVDEDDIVASGEILDHMLSMPELLDTLVTLRELLAANDEHHLFDDFAANWGEFFLTAHDDATGENHLITAADALVTPSTAIAGQPMAVEAMLPYVDPIMDDLVVRGRLVEGIGDLADAGTLDDLPDQLRVLMTVDMTGGTLEPGEESALEAALVLLDEADAEFSCLDLISTDSVSVWLLQEIVTLGLEANTVEDLVDLIDGMYDWLVDVVDLACTIPAILHTHFEAIIRLAESGALQTLIPLLYAIADPDDPSHNYLRELVDIVHIALLVDLVEPLESLLAPTLGQPFMPAVLAILGAYVDPAYPLAAGDVYTLLDVADYLITPPQGEGYDRAPLVIAGRILDGIVDGEPEELDAFLVAWGDLLVDEDAVTNRLLYGIDGLLALDPELRSLDLLGDIFNDEDVCTHWLLLFEDQAFMDALGAPGTPDGQEVPMAMLGRLIADGTAGDLLVLLGWVVETLEAVGVEF